jgi:hypothetical protein
MDNGDCLLKSMVREGIEQVGWQGVFVCLFVCVLTNFIHPKIAGFSPNKVLKIKGPV